MRHRISFYPAILILSLVLTGCGAIGTCHITCSSQDGSQKVGPYYDETEATCETERAAAEAELKSWGAICGAQFVPY